MIYTDANDPNLPEEIKELPEDERNVYITINNLFLTNGLTKETPNADDLAHSTAIVWLTKWQNYQFPARGG